MIDWETVLSSDSEDELKELKLFLFRENARLENERKEMMELQDKFVKERVQFRDDMDMLNHRMVIERKRLKDESMFFDKKMQILQDGFKQLDLDRRHFEKERARFEEEKTMLTNDLSGRIGDDLPSDIASVLFRNTNNLLTIRKRYKDLMKIFHPDNLCGDASLVQMINREYEKKKAEI